MGWEVSHKPTPVLLETQPGFAAAVNAGASVLTVYGARLTPGQPAVMEIASEQYAYGSGLLGLVRFMEHGLEDTQATPEFRDLVFYVPGVGYNRTSCATWQAPALARMAGVQASFSVRTLAQMRSSLDARNNDDEIGKRGMVDLSGVLLAAAGQEREFLGVPTVAGARPLQPVLGEQDGELVSQGSLDRAEASKEFVGAGYVGSAQAAGLARELVLLLTGPDRMLGLDLRSTARFFESQYKGYSEQQAAVHLLATVARVQGHLEPRPLADVVRDAVTPIRRWGASVPASLQPLLEATPALIAQALENLPQGFSVARHPGILALDWVYTPQRLIEAAHAHGHPGRGFGSFNPSLIAWRSGSVAVFTLEDGASGVVSLA